MVELAELISLSDKAAIERFIRCIRNALWLDILRYRLEHGFWLGSGILLAAGIINVFFYKILISWGLIAALLPMVAGIFIALRKRPTMTNAASHADFIFNGKSLMVTAIELLYARSTTPSGFNPWIMQQAAHKAQIWYQQCKQTIYSNQNQFPWSAMAIALLGFYFILQQGVADKPQVKEIQSKTLTADTKPALVAALIDEIRIEEKKLQKEAPSLAAEPTEQLSSADQHALAEDARSNKKQADELKANDTRDSSQDTRTDNLLDAEAVNNQSQQNQQADAGIGTQADTNPSLSSANDIKKMSIKLVEIKLQDGGLVSSEGKGLPFKDHQVIGSDKQIKPLLRIASWKAFGAYTTHFSAAQQQYVTNYFKNSQPGK